MTQTAVSPFSCLREWWLGGGESFPKVTQQGEGGVGTGAPHHHQFSFLGTQEGGGLRWPFSNKGAPGSFQTQALLRFLGQEVHRVLSWESGVHTLSPLLPASDLERTEALSSSGVSLALEMNANSLLPSQALNLTPVFAKLRLAPCWPQETGKLLRLSFKALDTLPQRGSHHCPCAPTPHPATVGAPPFPNRARPGF